MVKKSNDSDDQCFSLKENKAQKKYLRLKRNKPIVIDTHKRVNILGIDMESTAVYIAATDKTPEELRQDITSHKNDFITLPAMPVYDQEDFSYVKDLPDMPIVAMEYGFTPTSFRTSHIVSANYLRTGTMGKLAEHQYQDIIKKHEKNRVKDS